MAAEELALFFITDMGATHRTDINTDAAAVAPRPLLAELEHAAAIEPGRREPDRAEMTPHSPRRHESRCKKRKQSIQQHRKDAVGRRGESSGKTG